MATSTLGWSPGVRMSREAKWIWKADTPAGVPAGARISAGKSGSVARSFPNSAVASVKRLPTSCMPSPESPAKRTMTRSRSSKAVLVVLWCSSKATSLLTLVEKSDNQDQVSPDWGVARRTARFRQLELVVPDGQYHGFPYPRSDGKRLSRARREVRHRDTAAPERAGQAAHPGRQRLDGADRPLDLPERRVHAECRRRHGLRDLERQGHDALERLRRHD